MRYEYGKRSENTQTQPGSPLAARTGTSGTVSDTLTPETERATGPSPQPDACRTRDTEGRHAPPAQYVRPRQRSRTRALGSHRSTLRYKEATRPAGVQRQRSKRRLSSWVSPPLPHPSLHMSRITLAVPAVLARGGLRARPGSPPSDGFPSTCRGFDRNKMGRDTPRQTATAARRAATRPRRRRDRPRRRRNRPRPARDSAARQTATAA